MDVSRLEQISISSRITLPDFTVKEIFMGFYETSNTKSETLLNIIKDILLRYELDITKLRGQCFNGAANMSGKYSGVQTLLRKLESRVLFVHCTAHILNLVAQDAMKNVEMINNFIGVAKDVISFIRDFPKRIAIFKDLQATCDENLPALSSFCPTSWGANFTYPCMRVKSLKTIAANYEQILFFLDEISTNKTDAGSKANGFSQYLQSFEFYFCLLISIQALEKIEILNAQLQKSDLNLCELHEKVKAILECIVEIR
ncbi:Zinc finger MYM-type protein 1 [Trachymyrmex cornetzi]|uniref:Zinc finger MYM-type protein 1 n=1 Tax=Trachymyrmex cornetzi TaxID=471704 RepID=A0A151JPI2_9HYME|nr:Zinc finger MYM-type protein 1 [Trachymyrmex cornetzi]